MWIVATHAQSDVRDQRHGFLDDFLSVRPCHVLNHNLRSAKTCNALWGRWYEVC